jgi:hypothetical protein
VFYLWLFLQIANDSAMKTITILLLSLLFSLSLKSQVTIQGKVVNAPHATLSISIAPYAEETQTTNVPLNANGTFRFETTFADIAYVRIELIEKNKEKGKRIWESLLLEPNDNLDFTYDAKATKEPITIGKNA